MYNRQGTVTHCNHLRQAAQLDERRHQNDIRRSVDQMGQSIAIEHQEPDIRILLEGVFGHGAEILIVMAYSQQRELTARSASTGHSCREAPLRPCRTSPVLSLAEKPHFWMGYFDRGVAVAQICCDAWHVGDIVQGEIRHELVHLQKQRQGLTDATRRAQYGDLSVLLRCRNGKR